MKAAELRANSGREEGGAFSLTGGAGNLAVHVEGVARDAGDYRVGPGWSTASACPAAQSHRHRQRGPVLGGRPGYLGAATPARPPNTACLVTTTS